VTRVAYIWVFINIVFALWFYSHEQKARHEAISEATKQGLALGVTVGCRQNNHIRHQVRVTARVLHPASDRQTVLNNLRDQNCRKEAKQIIRIYERAAGKW
jgi:hypothetical protein